jgi:putative Mg2+ transporter-C (MgtC) family protein
MFLDIVDPIANLFGEWSSTVNIYRIMLRISLAVNLVSAIGWERSNKRHAAGLRTFILAILTTTVAMILDKYIQEVHNNSIYFISGAAVLALDIISCNTTVYTSKSQIKRFTTSVALWGVSFIGFILGAGLYTTTLILFVVFLLSLSLFPKIETILKNRSSQFDVHLELTNASYLKDFTAV